jgi:hypothetical protein
LSIVVEPHPATLAVEGKPVSFDGARGADCWAGLGKVDDETLEVFVRGRTDPAGITLIRVRPGDYSETDTELAQDS